MHFTNLSRVYAYFMEGKVLNYCDFYLLVISYVF